MRTKYFLLILLFLNVTSGAFAQYDSIVKQMQKDFNAFKKGIEQEHRQFKTRNDSIFSAFLKGSWESFNVLFNPKPVEKPKPVVPPNIPNLQNLQILPEKNLPIDSSKSENNNIPEKIDKKPEKYDPAPEIERSGLVPVTFDFYGTPESISLPSTLPVIKEINANGLSSYFDETIGSVLVEQVVKQLTAIKREKKLNDWGFIQLVKKTTESISSSITEATLLSWIVLLKSGLNAKIGYYENQVFLMVPALEKIYVSWYLSINNTPYYIVSDGKDKMPSLTVHRADYPGNLPVSLFLKQIPELGNNIIHKKFTFRGNEFEIEVNQNLMDFYKNYPQCDLSIFFATPLSDQVTGSLDIFLLPLMKEMSASQKVAVLLEFTQKTFAYQSDREQFGREKFFFPDELFYYPFSDCEDRSILFTRLVKHFTGFSCIGLDFPKHVNTAVAMGDDVTGEFVKFHNRKYHICDPTYINAPVGYLPKEFSTITPEVINFE
jgi:hypothetical protein